MVALTNYQQKMKILNWLEKMDSAVDKIGPSKVGKIKVKYKIKGLFKLAPACIMDGYFIFSNNLELDLGRFC